MNYRHAFHAGNFADVHKHLVLLALLEHLLQKPKPFFVLDTHAGRGLYDLKGQDAERGNEWQVGIGKLFGQTCKSPLLNRYLQCITEAQQGAGQLHSYPGSPLLINQLLRDGDRRAFIERNAEECVALRKALRLLPTPNTTIDDADGYQALKRFLPPKEKRGLVLIDPPFEDANEFRHLVDELIMTAERWPTGMYAIWYPLKSGGLTKVFQAQLKRSGLKKLLLAELLVRPAETPLGLNGSGMLIMNPPWQLDQQLTNTFAELLPLLAVQEQGSYRVEWLVGE